LSFLLQVVLSQLPPRELARVQGRAAELAAR